MLSNSNILSENVINEDQIEWQTDDFIFGEFLGNGKFGYVYKAIDKKSKKELAIKVISKNIIAQFNILNQLKNEVEIHSRLM